MTNTSFNLENGIFLPFSPQATGVGVPGQFAVWTTDNKIGPAGVPSGSLLDQLSGFTSTGILQRTGAGAYSFLPSNTGVTPGSYTNASITVDANGRIVVASNGAASGGSVTQVNTGTGLTGGPITTTGTLSLDPTTIARLLPTPPVSLVSKGGHVQAAPYQATQSGSANFGPTSGETALEMVTIGQTFRFRQHGDINQVKLNVPTLTGITGLYVKIWRLQGTSYDLVATSIDLHSSLSAGVNTIDLSANPIKGVRIGDYIGLRVEYSGGASVSVLTSTVIGNTSFTGETTQVYSVTNTTPSTAQYAWASQTLLSGSGIIVECYMAAPVFVSMGDSITSGAPLMAAFGDNWANTVPLQGNVPNPHAGPYPYVLASMLGVTHQNAGRTGEETGPMLTRFATDVVAKNPQFVTIMGGVNNILHSGSSASIISDLTAMVNAANTAGIKVVLHGILPFRQNGSNAFMQARDTVNTAMAAVIAGIPGAIYINPDYLGFYWSGGDPNNYWSLNYSSSQDFLHPGQAGYTEIARVIKNAVTANPESTAPLNGGTLNVTPGFYYSYDGVRCGWTSPQLLNTFWGPYAGAANVTTSVTPVSGNNNTGIGYSALANLTSGVNNVAVGANALIANTSGGNSIAIGLSALAAQTTASSNIAIGTNAALLLTTGAPNIAIGQSALAAVTTGTNNIAIGQHTLETISTVSSNTAVGHTALQHTTTVNNTAFGYGAALAQTTGGGTVSIGYLSLSALIGGNFNTALGWEAGLNVTSGGGNTFVGASAGSGITTGSNNTVIGGITGLSASLANAIVLGDGANNIRLDYGKTNASTWTFAAPLATTGFTVSTLPAAGIAGRRAHVTDATSPTWLATLTGGGAVKCPVFDNGTAWVAG